MDLRAACALSLAVTACGSTASAESTRQLQQALRTARSSAVQSRATRDEHSRILSRALTGEALKDITPGGLQALLGTAAACDRPICRAQGFRREDWYYEVGNNQAPDKVGQMPVLLVSFDRKGHATRMYALTTH